MEHPFQIGRYQDIHRGTFGSVKLPVAVIDAGTDEVGQHIIPVGCANESADRHPHFFGINCCQNIAEVSGRHDNIEFFPGPERTIFQQVAIR